jgi:polyisoprenoid-binding protein YceI
MFKAVRLFGVGLLSVLLLSGVGVAETYKIDAGHSSVDFSIRHLVGRTSGHFNTFTGTVMYDPAHPEKTSVDATIETGSIDTGHEGRDNHLRNDDFFDAEKYPTKAITLPVTVLGVGVHPRNKAPLAGFETEIVLKRSDYGVNNYTDIAGVLGDEVKVHIALETKGPKPEKMDK